MKVDAEQYAAFLAAQEKERARRAERVTTLWVRWAREVNGDPQSILRAYKMARDLMAEHGVGAWTLRIGNGRREAGSARSHVRDGLFTEPGTITLSGTLMSLWTEKQQRDTILHEIAHARTGPRHDSRWARACHALGIPAVRLWGEDGEAVAPPRPRNPAARPWVGTCPGGHPHKPRTREPTVRYSCSVCSPGRFDEDAVITWEKQ